MWLLVLGAKNPNGRVAARNEGDAVSEGLLAGAEGVCGRLKREDEMAKGRRWPLCILCGVFFWFSFPRQRGGGLGEREWLVGFFGSHQRKRGGRRLLCSSGKQSGCSGFSFGRGEVVRGEKFKPAGRGRLFAKR